MLDYQIEKRFGTIAVEKGYIKGNQLHEAMMVQLNEDLHGQKHRLLGQILLKKGNISPTQIREVLAHMGFPTKFLPRQLHNKPGFDDQKQSTNEHRVPTSKAG